MIGTSCFSYTKEDQRPDTTAMLVKTNRIEAYVPGRGPGSSVIHDIVHDAQSGIIPQISTKDFSTTWKNLDSDVEVDVMNNVGQTPLSVLCGQPRGDSRLVNLFLSSGADPNARPGCLPKYTGLTCLHQAIYSLQPLKIPGLSTFVDHASTFARFNPEFVSWPRSAKFHSSQTRELQRQKIRALVDHGVDLFAVSTEFGTPTDVARLSDNFFLWCSVLADSGIDVPKFLARDKTVLRNFRLGCWYRKKQQSQAIRRDMGERFVHNTHAEHRGLFV
ncbi:hypothetical protein B0T18DRAFT_172979 [Schizothecium vesticola]|uniref:Ankyrin n=1 Tax=Schizothecium vesticola TaxID=314040 RepID=A0AA40K1X6_9PEZI|nr:hypothetical protein B0T18DRAFT_172979 [Schizothecium vesticola]